MGDDGKYSAIHHAAELTAVMGPPPPEFLQRSEILEKGIWDKDGKSILQIENRKFIYIQSSLLTPLGEIGNWIDSLPLRNMNLENLAKRYEGEDKINFLAFIRKTLKWNPDERPEAIELLSDPWLMKDLLLAKAQKSQEHKVQS
jgi:serine/threonine-protein kinase SRPK3